jgi:hypothetical protein
MAHGAREQLLIESGAQQRYVSGLLLADDVAGAADLESSCGDGEARSQTVEGDERGKPRAGSLRRRLVRAGQQIGDRLRSPSTCSAAVGVIGQAQTAPDPGSG